MKEPIKKAIEGYARKIENIDDTKSQVQEEIQRLDEKYKYHTEQIEQHRAKQQELRDSIEHKLEAMRVLDEERAESWGRMKATEEFAEELLD